jgi:hypothetical protein
MNPVNITRSSKEKGLIAHGDPYFARRVVYDLEQIFQDDQAVLHSFWGKGTG